jgi:hypothetical protein
MVQSHKPDTSVGKDHAADVFSQGIAAAISEL